MFDLVPGESGEIEDFDGMTVLSHGGGQGQEAIGDLKKITIEVRGTKAFGGAVSGNREGLPLFWDFPGRRIEQSDFHGRLRNAA